MPLQHLEHFLIQTADLEATRDWYVNILGFREGPHPDFKFPVIWLYLGDTDVIHLTQGGKNVSENRKAYLGQQSDAVHGSGVLDHVAFRCTGFVEAQARLAAQGHAIKVNDGIAGLKQIMLTDPNGINVELNYTAD